MNSAHHKQSEHGQSTQYSSLVTGDHFLKTRKVYSSILVATIDQRLFCYEIILLERGSRLTLEV
jgi:hypothetical protein